MPPKRKQRATPRASKQAKTSNEEGESISSIVSMTSNEGLNEGPQPLRSFCDSLGLHLSSSIRSKIIKGEFVDLGSLLTQNIIGYVSSEIR